MGVAPDREYVNPFSDNIVALGQQIDAAADNRNIDELKKLATEAENFFEIACTTSRAMAYFCAANALAESARLENKPNEEQSLGRQLYLLRESIDLIEKENFLEEENFPYVVPFVCSVYANHANLLDSIGRKIAAIESYKSALLFHPTFGMALGNLGRVYQHYAMLVSDIGHHHHFHHCAYPLLKEALELDDPNVHCGARKIFEDNLAIYPEEYVEKFLSVPYNYPQYEYPEEELLYREWVLHNGLFLNPMNDLSFVEFAFAADTMQLPSITIKDGFDYSKPVFHGIFNQLKQEYIFARYQYYCSIQAIDEVHYADKETNLTNTLDYTQHSIRIEQLKSSFRIAYSLFDKIAYFINIYFELGIAERQIDFKKLWTNQALCSKQNYALNALRWIYKDLRETLSDATKPKADHLYELRNALEHRHVKVISEIISDCPELENKEFSINISEAGLERHTLQLLKLVREAIIYLVFAVRIEEHVAHSEADDGLQLPIHLHTFDDDWKL